MHQSLNIFKLTTSCEISKQIIKINSKRSASPIMSGKQTYASFDPPSMLLCFFFFLSWMRSLERKSENNYITRIRELQVCVLLMGITREV